MDSLVDLTDVQRLIEIVQRHALEGLTVADDDVAVEIVAEPQLVAASPLSAGGALEPASRQPAPAEEAANPHLLQLRSPITGVFYRSPQPTEPAFVQSGDVVEADDPVCLIEAMKIFNEIPAGVNGRLVKCHVQNEQLVVSGELLMEFEPLEDAS